MSPAASEDVGATAAGVSSKQASLVLMIISASANCVVNVESGSSDLTSRFPSGTLQRATKSTPFTALLIAFLVYSNCIRAQPP